ncbi:MAG TPA: TonB-dependent receptor, partial [Lacibacter sp.]|nr:TonB-dependent receptor [Lacibacter sp.]
TTNMYHNLSWKESLGGRWKLQAGISYTRNTDTLRFGMQDAGKQDVQLQGLEFKEAALQSRGDYLNAKLVVEKRFRGLNVLRLGSEVNRSNDVSGFTIYNGTRFVTRIPETITAVFAEQDLYLTNQLAAKLGVRGEYSQLLARTNLAPRLSLAYKLGKQSQASLAYGEFFQNPELRQLPMLAPLQFQRATHYIAQYQLTTRLTTLRLEAFHKQYHNLVKTEPVNGRQLAASNGGIGEASGIELFWRDKKNIKNLDYWISYSFLDTRRDFLNFPGRMAPNFAARHTASVVAKKFVTNWKTNINFSYNYASGRPFYNILHDAGTNKPFLNDQGRTPDYHNMSLALNYLPHIGKKDARMFAVYVLSVSNVMNFRQVFGYTYSANGQRRQALEPPARMFVFIGAFISFGVDRTDDAINNNL